MLVVTSYCLHMINDTYTSPERTLTTANFGFNSTHVRFLDICLTTP